MLFFTFLGFFFVVFQTSAMKLVIEMDDIGRGLEELIVQHRITKLVMGAAEDAKYHRYALIVSTFVYFVSSFTQERHVSSFIETRLSTQVYISVSRIGRTM